MKRPTNEQIDLWYPRLFRTALRMTGCPETAADLTQQAFHNAWRKWDQFEGNVLPTTWIHQILVNCVRDWARRRTADRTRSLNDWDCQVLSDSPDPVSDHSVRAEQLTCLRDAIANLSEKIKPTFVATVLDGYSYQEAAELLSVPLGTVASRVFEARRQIAVSMRRRFPEVES